MAREACERFGWRDGMGRLKEMACRKELTEVSPEAKRKIVRDNAMKLYRLSN